MSDTQSDESDPYATDENSDYYPTGSSSSTDDEQIIEPEFVDNEPSTSSGVMRDIKSKNLPHGKYENLSICLKPVRILLLFFSTNFITF